MTIKTLTFIHNLLKEEAAKREDAKKWILERYYEATENNAPNAETLRTQYNVAKEKYYEATNALEDFEQKEW